MNTTGTLCNHKGNAKENDAKKFKFFPVNVFAIIPTHYFCLMWPKCPGAELEAAASKFRKGK